MLWHGWWRNQTKGLTFTLIVLMAVQALTPGMRVGRPGGQIGPFAPEEVPQQQRGVCCFE